MIDNVGEIKFNIENHLFYSISKSKWQEWNGEFVDEKVRDKWAPSFRENGKLEYLELR